MSGGRGENRREGKCEGGGKRRSISVRGRSKRSRTGMGRASADEDVRWSAMRGRDERGGGGGRGGKVSDQVWKGNLFFCPRRKRKLLPLSHVFLAGAQIKHFRTLDVGTSRTFFSIHLRLSRQLRVCLSLSRADFTPGRAGIGREAGRDVCVAGASQYGGRVLAAAAQSGAGESLPLPSLSLRNIARNVGKRDSKRPSSPRNRSQRAPFSHLQRQGCHNLPGGGGEKKGCQAKAEISRGS